MISYGKMSKIIKLCCSFLFDIYDVC